jgi:hypothetical protein
MDMSYIGYALLAAVVGMLVWVTVGSSKKTWYKVYLANGDILLLQRDLKERWWRTSDRYMRFKDERGREITFYSGGHWVLMTEEVPNSELGIVKDELQRHRAEIIAKRDK